MAHAYTPGLRVTERATVRKERRLPIAGRVLVEVGARVRAEDVVARAELPGDVATVNVVNQLGIAPAELSQYMLKQEGEPVAREEVIAETRPWIKWFKTIARAPVEGTIETVSAITGQVIIRTPPRPVDLTAYLDGTVAEVFEGEGVAVEASGAFIQGIFGVGGEIYGEIAIAASKPNAVITPDGLGKELAGKIVVAGSLVTSEVYERASAIGIAALVCGGFHDRDLRRLLGYDLGVAITGHEDIKPILIITEGFGPMAMAQGTFELLKANAGRRASANGATQIRAGVLRPEIIIPASSFPIVLVPRPRPRPRLSWSSEPLRQAQKANSRGRGRGTRTRTIECHAKRAIESAPPMVGLTQGSPVRIIREPGFGRIGVLRSLPPGAVQIETESRVRVAEVQFTDGTVVTVPRANLEAIES